MSSGVQFAVSLQNVQDGDGFALAVTGMAIVLSGLALIVGYIAVLPVALRAWDRVRSRGRPLPAVVPTLTPEKRAALAWVATRELESFQLGDRQRLTFRPLHRPSLWDAMPRLYDLSPRSIASEPCAATNSSSTTRPSPSR
jgi:Na+-transporting methylmalonyl-CoA/oxaloacetate decarboxylase gamma subunit